MKKLAIVTALALFVFSAGVATAQTEVTVNSGLMNLGYMNVFNLPAPDGDGAWQFGSSWGVADLTAVWSGDDVTLGPNTIGDPNEYWYQCIGLPDQNPPDCGVPGAPGNKIMEAALYAQVDGALAGQEVVFTGIVAANSFTEHTVMAYIRDFAPDFSSFVEATIPLTVPGDFSVSLTTINDPARHVQYGFITTGVNVWVTDVGPFGSMTIGPDPNVQPEVLSEDKVVCLQVCLTGFDSPGGVCVTGSRDELTNWGDGVPMVQIGPDLYQACLVYAAGTPVPVSAEFKFKKDDCQTWESTPNRSFSVTNGLDPETTLTYVWEDGQGACEPVATKDETWGSIKAIYR